MFQVKEYITDIFLVPKPRLGNALAREAPASRVEMNRSRGFGHR